MGIGVMEMTMPSAMLEWKGDSRSLLLMLLPVWALGLLAGVLLPRPRWLEDCTRTSALYLSTPPGTFLRRAVVLCHGLLVVRVCWRSFAIPGTFRALLRSLWNWACGHGFSFSVREEALSAPGKQETVDGYHHAQLDWYVNESDLEKFKMAVDSDTPQEGYGAWEPMMDKVFPGVATYKAWRRSTPSGKTEYKSTTVAAGATATEFMDFYLDDPTRMKWDGMISLAESLEVAGEPSDRLQVVLWRRSFPFAFLSDREYVIARRVFAEGPALYGITKAIDHPAAPRENGIVRMETFYSMWRSHTVACPFGTGGVACETTLLHFEDFGIPEGLARFAVRHGMSGFIKKMLPAVRSFVDARRARVDPDEADPDAYGVRAAAEAAARARRTDNALMRTASAPSLGGRRALRRTASTASMLSSASDASMASDGALYVKRGSRQRREVGPLRRLGTLALAAGVAVAVGHSATAAAVRRRPARRA